MKLKVVFLFVILTLFGCATQGPINRDSASVFPQTPSKPEITHQTIVLESNPVPIEVYQSGVAKPGEAMNLMLLLAPATSFSVGSSEDPLGIKPLILETGFQGVVVPVFPEKFNQQKVFPFKKPGSFSAWITEVLTRSLRSEKEVEVKSLILVGVDEGGPFLNQLSRGNEALFGKILSVALLSGRFPQGAEGIVRLMSQAPMGFRLFAVLGESQERPAEWISQKLEAIGAVENIFEIEPDLKLQPKILVEDCLPKFMAAISRDPFVTFRCF